MIDLVFPSLAHSTDSSRLCSASLFCELHLLSVFSLYIAGLGFLGFRLAIARFLFARSCVPSVGDRRGASVQL